MEDLDPPCSRVSESSVTLPCCSSVSCRMCAVNSEEKCGSCQALASTDPQHQVGRREAVVDVDERESEDNLEKQKNLKRTLAADNSEANKIEPKMIKLDISNESDLKINDEQEFTDCEIEQGATYVITQELTSANEALSAKENELEELKTFIKCKNEELNMTTRKEKLELIESLKKSQLSACIIKEELTKRERTLEQTRQGLEVETEKLSLAEEKIERILEEKQALDAAIESLRQEKDKLEEENQQLKWTNKEGILKKKMDEERCKGVFANALAKTQKVEIENRELQNLLIQGKAENKPMLTWTMENKANSFVELQHSDLRNKLIMRNKWEDSETKDLRIQIGPKEETSERKVTFTHTNSAKQEMENVEDVNKVGKMLTSLKNEKIVLEEKTDRLSKEVECVKAKNLAAWEKTKRLEKKIQLKTIENNKLNATLNTTKDVAATLSKSVNDLNRKIEELEKEKNEAKTALRNIIKAKKDTDQASEAQVDAKPSHKVKERVSNLEEEKAALQTKLIIANNKVDALKKENDGLKKKVGNQSTELKALKSKVIASCKKVKQLEKNNRHQKKTNNNLNTVSATDELMKLELKRRQENRNELAIMVSSLKKEKQGLEEKAEGLSKELEAVNGKFMASEQERTQLEKEIQEKNDKLSMASAAAKNAAFNLSKIVNVQKRRIEQLKNEKNEVETAAVSKHRQQITGAKMDCYSNRSGLEEGDMIKKELTDTNETLSRKEKELQQLKKEFEDQNEQLKRMTNDKMQLKKIGRCFREQLTLAEVEYKRIKEEKEAADEVIKSLQEKNMDLENQQSKSSVEVASLKVRDFAAEALIPQSSVEKLEKENMASEMELIKSENEAMKAKMAEKEQMTKKALIKANAKLKKVELENRELQMKLSYGGCRMREELESHVSRTEEKDAMNEAFGAQNNLLKEANENSEAKNAENEAFIAKGAADIEYLTVENEEIKAEYEHIKANMAEKEERAKTVLLNAKAKIQKVELENRELQKKLANEAFMKASFVDKGAAEIEYLSVENEEIKAEYEQMKAKMAEKEERAKTVLLNARAKIQKVELENRELQKKLANGGGGAREALESQVSHAEDMNAMKEAFKMIWKNCTFSGFIEK